MLDTKPILEAIFQDDHEALKTMLKTLEPNVGFSFAEIDAVSTESGDANRCYNLRFLLSCTNDTLGCESLSLLGAACCNALSANDENDAPFQTVVTWGFFM